MNYAAIIRDEGITFIIDGVPYQVLRSDTVFDKVKAAHVAEDYVQVKSLLDIGAGLVNFAEGSVSIIEGLVKWKDEEIDNSITRRMVRMMHEGFSITPMILFLNNLMENPSSRAVSELYLFLEQNELPITIDGYFLAYKKVTTTYMDKYTGKVDNSIGQKPTMRRNAVDEDRDKTCSTGYHFCSKDYLSEWGGTESRVMILKINPRDVVSIPSDYNNAKGRCCDYEVIGEWTEWHENFVANNTPLETNSVNSVYDNVGLIQEIEILKALIPTLTGKERAAARKRLNRRVVKLDKAEDQMIRDVVDEDTDDSFEDLEIIPGSYETHGVGGSSGDLWFEAGVYNKTKGLSSTLYVTATMDDLGKVAGQTIEECLRRQYASGNGKTVEAH